MAEFGARRTEGGSGRAWAGGELDDLEREVPTLRRVSAAGTGDRARRPPRGLSAPPARRDQSDMARWLITGCSTGIGREIARAALEAGHSRGRDRAHVARRSPTSSTSSATARVARRHSTSRTRPRSPRRSQPPTTRSAASTCWSTTPATATCRRSRRVTTRGPEAVRHQLLRRGRHDQGRAARHAGPPVRAHRQHLVDDRPGGQPAQRVLLLDQVRARGADRGAWRRRSSRSASR